MRALPLIVASGAALLACSGSEAPRPVSLRILGGDGTPLAGAPVVFHDVTGNVQEVTATDADGRAAAVVGDGALLTVGRHFWGTMNRWDLITIAGLRPGDALLLEAPPSRPLSGYGAITFFGPVDGASSYRVDASCNAAFADAGYVDALSLPMYGCGTSIDAVALARAPGGELLAYATAVDVPITGAAPAQAASIAMGAWRTDFGTLTVDVTNAPAGTQVVGAHLVPRRAGRSFSQSISGAGLAVAPGGAGSLALSYPRSFATSGRLQTTVYYGPSASGQTDGIGWVADPDTALVSRSIDLGTAIPPRLSNPAIGETGGSLRASWQQAAADPALDAVILTTWWTSGGDDHSWQVLAPAGATAFTFPALPPELAEYAPVAGAAPSSLQVAALDVAGTGGYDAFKAMGLGFVTGLPSTDALGVRGTTTNTP